MAMAVRLAPIAAAACVLALQRAPEAPAPRIATPVRQTDRVANDPDDPAVWIDAADPSRSLVLGTDKVGGVGGLYVFGLDGRLRQRIAPLDRPNNVDVEYGVRLGGADRDVAVLTERMRHCLRVFAVARDSGTLVDLAPGGLPILDGQVGQASEPMGIALYKRPRDGALFAIVAPKTGPATNYLWQYRLSDEAGRVAARAVRRFGAFSQRGSNPFDAGEIEAVAVDDELGFVYYSDERFGIRKYAADPDAADAARELAVFGRDGYDGDREGLAIYRTGGGTGFIVSSDQVSNGSRVRLYPREGAPPNPHDHTRAWTVSTVSDETDGLDATDVALPGFPRGFVVMMNSGARNFLIYRWEDLAPATAR